MYSLHPMAWMILLFTTNLLLKTTAHPIKDPQPQTSPDHYLEHDRYTFLPSIPTARQEHAITILNNSPYIAGGITSNYSYTPETLNYPSEPSTVSLFQRYDIVTGVWSDAAPLPVSINHGNIAAVDGKIYLLGGLLGLNFSLWDATPNSYVYDPVVDTWEEIAPMPTGTERGACAVGVRGNEIYLAAGIRSLEIAPDGLQDSVSLVTSYNTATNTWTTTYPPLPLPRDHLGGAIFGSIFIVTGGRDHGQFNVGLGQTWSLDLDSPSTGWEELASLPTPRGGLAVTRVGHCLYTFGGEGNPNDEHGVFDNVEVLDVRTGEWSVEDPLWHGIHGTNAVTGDDGTVYVAGGGYQLSAGASNFSVAYAPKRKCLEGGW